MTFPPSGARPPGPAGAPPVDPYAAGGAYASPPAGSTAAPPHAAGPYEDVGDVSLGELVGNVTRDLSTLLRQ